MITVKQAYITLINLKYKMNDIENNLLENQPVRANFNLTRMRDDVERIIKPFYSTVGKKQKKELLEGWDPDTNDGKYLNIKDTEFLKVKDG